MKRIISFCLAAWITAGCAAGINISKEDADGLANRDAGPGLCSDGTPPPCNPPRD